MLILHNLQSVDEKESSEKYINYIPDRITMTVNVNDALLASIEELTAQNSKFKDNFKQLKAQHDRLQLDYNALQKRANELEASLNQERERHNQERENLKMELDRRISDALAIRDLVSEPVDLTSARESALKEARNSFLTQLAAVAEEAAQSQSELQRLQQTTNDALSRAKMEAVDMRATIERLQSELTHERSLRTSAETRCKTLEDTVEKLQREIVTSSITATLQEG